MKMFRSERLSGGLGWPETATACRPRRGWVGARHVPRLTSCGSQAGDQCLLKGGIFFQACTAQNWLRMVKYGTYLDLNTSQEAPKHCPTLDALTQCFASAHFRSPPVRLQFRSPSNFAAPPIWREIHSNLERNQ